MSEEDDLNGIDGWLLIYVALKYVGAVVATLEFCLLFRAATSNGHPPNHALPALLFLIAVGIVTGAAAATAVLRTSRWALQLAGFDLLCGFVAIAIAAIIGFTNGVSSQQFPLLRTAVQIAALCAWFQYFRVSRRVHATFGRNLLEDAAQAA